MHTTKMCDPFVDISIIHMIQSTFVSGLLCLSFPLLKTDHRTVSQCQRIQAARQHSRE